VSLKQDLALVLLTQDLRYGRAWLLARALKILTFHFNRVCEIQQGSRKICVLYNLYEMSKDHLENLSEMIIGLHRSMSELENMIDLMFSLVGDIKDVWLLFSTKDPSGDWLGVLKEQCINGKSMYQRSNQFLKGEELFSKLKYRGVDTSQV